MNNIQSLINPARIIKVEDARKIAKIQVERTGYAAAHLDTYASEVNRKALRVLQSFESLYALKLEKGHFVCEVEKPKWTFEMPIHSEEYAYAMEAYEAAQAKVIFEGFVNGNNPIWNWNVFMGEPFLGVQEHNGTVTLSLSSYRTNASTIGDLFHAIEVYNRAAPTPIPLKYTSNILSLLKIEG